MKKAFNTLWQVLSKLEHFVVVICCVTMVSLVFATVVLRYIFEISFQGMEELIMLFAFGIYFIGGALGSRDESQITADVMSMVIKKPRPMLFLRSLQNLGDAILIGICGVFSTQQMVFVLGQHSRTAALKLPVWIIYTIILTGLFLMAFYALCHCVRYFMKAIHYHEETTDSGEEGQA